MRLLTAAVMAALLFAAPASAACITPAQFGAVWMDGGGALGTPRAVPLDDKDSRTRISHSGILVPGYDVVVPLTDSEGKPWLGFFTSGCFIGAFRLGDAI